MPRLAPFQGANEANESIQLIIDLRVVPRRAICSAGRSHADFPSLNKPRRWKKTTRNFPKKIKKRNY